MRKSKEVFFAIGLEAPVKGESYLLKKMDDSGKMEGSWINTSEVQRIKFVCDGVWKVVTMNSIYIVKIL